MRETAIMTDRSNRSLLPRRLYWEAKYRDGVTPWDTKIVPPEVVTFWRSGLLPTHGRAIDMGCGTGTNVEYLRSLGLDAVGFDLTITGLETGIRSRKSSGDNGPINRAYVLADTSALPLNTFEASYILDIGCLHTIPQALRPQYVACVVQNLTSGGYYHLYAHTPLPEEHPRFSDDSGLQPGDVIELFGPDLTLLTTLEGKPERRSNHWYLLRKP